MCINVGKGVKSSIYESFCLKYLVKHICLLPNWYSKISWKCHKKSSKYTWQLWDLRKWCCLYHLSHFWNAESILTEKLDLLEPQQKTCTGDAFLPLEPRDTLSSESANTQRSGQGTKGLLWGDRRPTEPLLPLAIAEEMALPKSPKLVF